MNSPQFIVLVLTMRCSLPMLISRLCENQPVPFLFACEFEMSKSDTTTSPSLDKVSSLEDLKGYHVDLLGPAWYLHICLSRIAFQPLLAGVISETDLSQLLVDQRIPSTQKEAFNDLMRAERALEDARSRALSCTPETSPEFPVINKFQQIDRVIDLLERIQEAYRARIFDAWDPISEMLPYVVSPKQAAIIAAQLPASDDSAAAWITQHQRVYNRIILHMLCSEPTLRVNVHRILCAKVSSVQGAKDILKNFLCDDPAWC